MAYEFGGCLYRNRIEFHAAIAEKYLSADGLNDREFMLSELAAHTDEQLTSDMLRPREWGDLLENDGFDRDAMVQAFADLRANFDSIFPEDAE